MGKDYYTKNCVLWSKIEPEGAQSVQANTTHRIDICTSQNGHENLRIVRDGNTAYVHDETDPVQEAKTWASTLELKGYNVLFVYGVGLGYYYDPLVPWLREDPDHFLVFIEDDPEIIRRLFETEHATKLLKDPQVRLYYIEDFKKASEKFDQITSNFMGSTFRLSAVTLYLRTRSSDLIHLNTILSFMMNMKQFLHEEYRNFGLAFFRNYFANLFSLPQSFLGKSLWNQYQGVPAIICGAGPSLNKNIEVLKTLQNKALIFAGGTAINVLNAAGIHPHFGAGIDPNPEQLARIVSNESFQTPFFVNFRMNSYALQAIQGDHLYVGSGAAYKVADWIDEELDILGPKIVEGYNVVNYTLSVAKELGCNPIIVVGTDLAYSEGESYAQLLMEHPLYRGTSRFVTKNSQEDLVAQKDIYGNSVFTLWKWLLESVWFSNFALTFPEVKLINATEGGLGFPGVSNQTLAEVAQKELGCEYDFQGMVHAEIQQAQMPEAANRENILGVLHELSESLVRCETIYCEIADEYKKLSKRLEEGMEISEELTSEKIAASLNQLNEEKAYIHILSSFNDHLIKAIGRGLERLDLDQEWLSQAEIFQQHLELHHMRYSTLKNAALSISLVLKETLEMYQRQIEREKTYASIDQKRFLEEIQKESSDVYALENGRLTLIDPSLDIHFSEPFDPSIPAHHSREYDANGMLKMEQYYLDNCLHGPSTYYEPDGQVLAQRWFIHGLPEGKARYYSLNRQLIRLNRYRHGLLQGSQEAYFENGLLRLHYSCEKGEFDGPVRLFYPNGQLKREIPYRLGKREGVETLWSYEGKKLGQAEYHEGHAVGEAKFWDSQGHVLKCVTFDPQGNLIQTQIWDEEGHPLNIEDHMKYDYFDRVTRKVQAFTQNINQIAEGIDQLIPLVGVDDDSEGVRIETLRADLEKIRSEIKNLEEIVQVMVNRAGLNPNRPEEAIWKTPTMEKSVEEIVEKVSSHLKKHLDQIETAFIEVLNRVIAKTDENNKK